MLFLCPEPVNGVWYRNHNTGTTLKNMMVKVPYWFPPLELLTVVETHLGTNGRHFKLLQL